jgi:hypothetical protein
VISKAAAASSGQGEPTLAAAREALPSQSETNDVTTSTSGQSKTELLKQMLATKPEENKNSTQPKNSSKKKSLGIDFSKRQKN